MSIDRATTRRITVALTALALLLAAAPALAGGGAHVTRGTFTSFADGPALGYDLSGHAAMVRTPRRTVVRVRVAGLTPGDTYAAHVHAQACADGDAGGHYRFDAPVPGGALDGHEIWPGPFTANAAGRAQGGTVVGAVAGADAVSVVVHAPGGTKIACADLR